MSSLAHCRTFVGHPVDVVTGEVFTVANDFLFHGPLPLVWQREYSSSRLERSPLGLGWQTEFFCTLRMSGRELIFTTEQGAEVVFALPPPGQSFANGAAQMELLDEPAHYVVWNWHHQRKFYFAKTENGSVGMHLTRIADLPGHAINLFYSGNYLTDLTDSVNRRLRIRYSAGGLIESISLVPSEGGTTTEMLVRYEYDDEGHLVTSYDRAGQARRYEYNATHLLTKETNRLGGAFYFVYDARNRCVHNSGDGGFMERRLVYDDTNLTTTVYDSLGFATVYQRTPNGQITSITNPSGAITQKVFNASGQLTLLIEPSGDVTSYEYDDKGNVASLTYPNGATQRWTYNDLHLPDTSTSTRGAIWRWSYTETGAVKTLTDPTGAVWEYRWGQNNLISELVAPNGHRTLYYFDPQWRWMETSDTIVRNRVEFDVFGYVTAVYDAEGLKRRYTMDANNQVIAIEDSEGAVHRMIRDANGNLTSILHPQEGEGHYRVRYDRFGNMIERVDPNGGVATWSYDSEDRVTEIQNELGDVARFTYDPQGRLLQQVFFDGHVERYERDAAGRPIAVIDGEGRRTRYKWDAMQEVTERKFADGTVESYAYDKAGSLISGKNVDSEVRFEYDLLGRLIAEMCNGHRVEYQYDSLGNMITQHYLQGSTGALRFIYDTRGRMIAIADSQGVFQELEYDALDRLKQRKAGEVRETLEYNTRRRLARQTVTGPAGSIVDRRYEYDVLDNLVSIHDARWGDSRYEYDGKEQITVEAHSSFGTARFSYDAAGNLAKGPDGTRTYGAGNRLLTAQDKQYGYDANGSLIRITQASGQTELKYDGARRLREMVAPDGRRTSYSYDAMGRRISKTYDGRKTEFVWAVDDLAAELPETGAPVEHLMLGSRPLAQWQDGQRRAYITDQMFAVHELIGTDGSVVWAGDYNPLGRLRTQIGGSGGCFLRTAGRYSDLESGLQYNRFRYFDPEHSRFIGVDPFRTSRRLNHYWAGPSVVNWMDPLGLECGKPACGEIGVDKDGVYTDPAGRKHTDGVPENVNSILLDSGESRDFPNRIRRAINQIGDRDGCSTCPAKDPGTTPGVSPRGPGEPLGNWVVDHDPPVSQGGPPYRGRPQ